jgi:hypothetical protein
MLLPIAAVLAAAAAVVGAPSSTDDGFTADLDSKGGIEVKHRTGAAVLYRVASSFSEPGPVFHRLGRPSGSQQQGWAALGPASATEEGISVTGEARDFTVTRTISVRHHAILVNDTVRALANATAPIVGMEVNHLLEVVGGQQLREATVPGAPWTFGCDSMHEDGESGRRLHRGTSGNPTIHLSADSGGSVPRHSLIRAATTAPPIRATILRPPPGLQ